MCEGVIAFTLTFSMEIVKSCTEGWNFQFPLSIPFHRIIPCCFKCLCMLEVLPLFVVISAGPITQSLLHILHTTLFSKVMQYTTYTTCYVNSSDTHRLQLFLSRSLHFTIALSSFCIIKINVHAGDCVTISLQRHTKSADHSESARPDKRHR